MKTLIKNIKKLVQIEDKIRHWVAGADMAKINSIENAFLLINDDEIEDFGPMASCPKDLNSDNNLTEIDATGKMVFPSFVDSHTHLVYAGSREIEYIDKIKGLSYEEIAKRGGGILNSAKRLHNATEEELYEQALPRINEIISQGTGAVEIKSGYGLNPEDEIKMLRVIKKLKETTPLRIKATFLGAHAVPADYKGRANRICRFSYKRNDTDGSR
jgi:imidazolonepropionase